MFLFLCVFVGFNQDECFIFSIPKPRDVNINFVNVPYVFVADDAFSLTENMLKPYGAAHLTKEERILNYRLSRARRMIENSFGILSSKWRIFRTTINADVEIVESIGACVCLHNWLRSKQGQESFTYIAPDLVDRYDASGNLIVGSWRNEENNFISLERSKGNLNRNGKDVRNAFKQYFNGEGSVDWQESKI